MSGIKIKRFKVLLVDDHPVVREGLAMLLGQNDDILVTGMVGDAVAAMASLEKNKPDIIVADLSLPGLGGLEFIKRVKAKYPEMLVLVLSMHDEGLYAERVLRAGAKGYLMKQEAPNLVAVAIRKIHSGEIFLSEAIKSKILLRLSQGGGDEALENQLTDRELEVYQWLGRGLGTRKIAEALSLSVKTIETHCANIKKKLHLTTSPQLLSSAVRWMEQQKTG